jgi:hypothetical protein
MTIEKVIAGATGRLTLAVADTAAPPRLRLFIAMGLG